MAGISSVDIKTNNNSNSSQEVNESKKSALVALTFLFFMWGFITCLNDILIPYLKGVFELSFFQAMLVQFAFFGAYFVGSLIYFIISITSGDPITKIGYKNGIIIGLLISAVGCALFYPAAEYQVYALFLGALFCLGLGITMLQIAANPYVAILGSPETASSRLNMAQGFNSFGTTIAPVIGAALIFGVFASEETSGADAVKIPYLGLAAMFVILSLVIKATKLPVFTTEAEVEKSAGALKYPHLVLGILAIFMYVGGEVSIGSIMVNFFGLENIAGLEEEEASSFLAFYWGGAMIGRFLGAISLSEMSDQTKKLLMMVGVSLAAFGVIYGVAYSNTGIHFTEVIPYTIFLVVNLVAFKLGKAKAGKTLGIFAVVVMALLAGVIVLEGKVAFWCIIAIGLFNSIMFSNIFTLAIDGLGKYTSQASSLLVMGIVGGALVPLLQGFLADTIGVQASFVVPIICYAYIFFYGVKGATIGRK